MLTIKNATAETGIPRSNLYKLASQGAIEIRKSGRRSLITGESLANYLKNLPQAPIRKAVA
jgi:excisionase family DNA binding protein